MPRRGTYVDNAQNRRLGRVGMAYGSCVASSTSRSSCGGGYTSSSYSSYSSPRTYVDNAANRSLGRVGKPVGSHVVSRDGSVTVSGSSATSSSSSSKVYVDNTKNRSLERVGLPHGACVEHRDGSVTRSRDVSASSCDTSVQRSSALRSYADNAYNRRLGRVGKPLGSHVLHKDESKTVSSGAMPKVPKPKTTQELLSEYNLEEIHDKLRQLDFRDPDRQVIVNVQDTLQRSEIEEKWEKAGISLSTDHSLVSAKEIIPWEDITLEKKIGEGGFGIVFSGLWRGTPIAYKKLITQMITNKKKRQLVNEIQIFSKLKHPNIVQMFGVVVEEEHVGVVMEYLPKTLFHALFNEEIKFDCAQKKKLITEVISAISYLHSSNIAHCDIKCQNVLLDHSNVPKVCDFGLSAIKNSTTSTTSASAAPGQGTPRYAAPEVLRGELLRLSGLKMADIYSLTLVIYQILVEEEPFEDLNHRQLIVHVGEGEERPQLDETLAEHAKDLLAKGWVKEPIRRPNITELAEAWSKTDVMLVAA